MPVSNRSQEAASRGSGWLLKFPAGIPAFEQETAFYLLAPKETAPIVFLQSARTAGLCFLAVPVEHVAPDYELALSSDDATAAGFAAGGARDEMQVLAILTPSGRSVTANLLAPVVVNAARGMAVQAVRSDNRYSARAAVHIPAAEARGC